MSGTLVQSCSVAFWPCTTRVWQSFPLYSLHSNRLNPYIARSLWKLVWWATNWGATILSWDTDISVIPIHNIVTVSQSMGMHDPDHWSWLDDIHTGLHGWKFGIYISLREELRELASHWPEDTLYTINTLGRFPVCPPQLRLGRIRMDWIEGHWLWTMNRPAKPEPSTPSNGLQWQFPEWSITFPIQCHLLNTVGNNQHHHQGPLITTCPSLTTFPLSWANEPVTCYYLFLLIFRAT